MSLLTYNMVVTKAPLSPPPPWTNHSTPHPRRVVAQARKGLSSSRTRRLEKQLKKDGAITTKDEDEEKAAAAEGEIWGASSMERGGGGDEVVYSTGPMPAMQEEDQPDFWEGPQWEGLGFFIQYQWAFGIGFALIACGIAVSTFNEGATDFKQTPAYKESIQSQELLEEPEISNSNVFEGNPTEEAPSLE